MAFQACDVRSLNKFFQTRFLPFSCLKHLGTTQKFKICDLSMLPRLTASKVINNNASSGLLKVPVRLWGSDIRNG